MLMPLVAMPPTDGVGWTGSDFIIAAALLLGVGFAFRAAGRERDGDAHRWALRLALVSALVLAWATGAVGIAGSEADDVNVLYYGVLAVGGTGAVVARFRPAGMARAMAATALAQAAVATGALVAGPWNLNPWTLEVVAINGGFVVLWAGSAVLFRIAARDVLATRERTEEESSLSR